MEKFLVTVSRSESRALEFEVVARTRSEAASAAVRLAADTEFPRSAEAVYAVEGIAVGSQKPEPLTLNVFSRKGLSPESIEDITTIPADGFELVEDPSKLEAHVVATVFSTNAEAEAFKAGIWFIDGGDQTTSAIDSLTPDGETPTFVVLVHFGDSDEGGLRIEDKRR